MQDINEPFFITEDDQQPSGLMASNLKGERQTTILGMRIEAVDGLDDNEITTVETLIKERNELREQVSSLKRRRDNALKRALEAERKLGELRDKCDGLRAQISDRTAQRDRYVIQRNESLARAAKAEIELHRQKNGECNNCESLRNRIEVLAKWGEARAEECIEAQEEIAKLKNEIRHKKASETDDEETRSVVFYPFGMFVPKPYYTCIFRIREQGDYFFGHTLPDGSVMAAVGNSGHVKLKDTSNLYFAQIEECEETKD